jgi:hypothetical protein
MATNPLEPMMQFATPLLPFHEMLVSTWDKNNYMHFFQPHSTPLINESTLCLPKMAFALQSTLSLPTQLDPRRTNLLPWSCATQGFATSDAAQAKERSYHN